MRTFSGPAGDRGWIVICSNASRNGPYEQNFRQAGRLFSDVFSRFAVDPEKVFVAGFSGGARLASTLAVRNPQIRGVIACGAAFSPNPGQIPLPGARIAFGGIVGSRDMNYQEMWKAGEWLERIQLPHRMFFYDGEHRWPPEVHLQRAVNWMIMETTPWGQFEGPLVAGAYKQDNIVADTPYIAGRLFESHWEYGQMIRQYGAGYSGDVAGKRLRQIEKSRMYRKQVRVFETARREEDTLWRRYSEQFRRELSKSPPTPIINMQRDPAISFQPFPRP